MGPTKRVNTQEQAAILNRLSDTSAALVAAAKAIAKRMETLASDVERGYHVNNLGELQGNGSKLDILCAERQMLAEHARIVGADADDINVAATGSTGSNRTWFVVVDEDES